MTRPVKDAAGEGGRGLWFGSNRDLRAMATGYAGFSVAEWVVWLAILVYAHDEGGAGLVGIAIVVQLVPAAVVAPIASVLGDRHDRRMLLMGGYGLQALLALAVALAVLAEFPVWVSLAVAAPLSTSISLTRPVQGALIPDIARTPREVATSNSATGGIEATALVVGPLLAAALFALTGPEAAFAAAAVLFALAAASVTGMRGGFQPARGRQSRPMRDTVNGFRALVGDRHSKIVLGLGAAPTIVHGAVDVLIVAVAVDVLAGGDATVGILNSAVGVGALAGAATAARVVHRRRLARTIAVAMVIFGLPLVVLGLAPLYLIALGGLMALGSGQSVMSVGGRTLLQRVVPGHSLARAFGLVEGLRLAGISLGSVAAAAAISAVGVESTLVVAGVLLPLLAMASLGWLRSVDEVAVVPTREIAALSRVNLFEPLQPTALAALASGATWRSVPAGTVVVREGDQGDEFFVLLRGNANVTTGRGDRINELGPMDHFGEIALLRESPRTATVTTTTATELLVVSRDSFLAAVTGHSPVGERANAEVEERLERSRRFESRRRKTTG